MKVEIKGYNEQYRQGVLACLKNNYPWMAEMSDEELYHWAMPFMEYEWKEELPDEIKEFQHGIVFLAGQQVVLYLGLSMPNGIGRDMSIFIRMAQPGL